MFTRNAPEGEWRGRADADPDRRDRALPRAPEGRGLLLIVVGASGSGKDTLLAKARVAHAASADVSFVRRVITRPPGDAHESHEGVDEATFLARREAGEFAVDWEAHGLRYGVPRRESFAALVAGHLLVVNGSRAALPRFAAVFPRRRIVHVTVPRAELARRLAARGRESAEAVERRLARRVDPEALDERCWRLDNGGPLASATTRFLSFVETARREARGAGAGGRPA